MNKTLFHRLFLLGGYDLEMLTIKQLLEDRSDCIVVDKYLCWGNALLSAYQEELLEYADCKIYGIELREDITAPDNYISIDHHNDKSCQPSSLEQVASILGVTLTRYQQLVAANDKGYIPAMKTLEASKDEINDIRRKDREAQGVTDEDELLAEQSIKNHLDKYKDISVVYSQTPRFSAICDRLFPYQRLLIYTDSEWTFYGEGKASLVEEFDTDIKTGRVYHGGGSTGYIGAAKGAFPSNEINDFVTSVKQRYEYI
jgi:hypothetical protein